MDGDRIMETIVLGDGTICNSHQGALVAGQELTGIIAALQPAYKVKYRAGCGDYIQCFVNMGHECHQTR